MGASKILFIAAAVCFGLSLFGIAVGTFNLVSLGLLLMAVGLAV